MHEHLYERDLRKKLDMYVKEILPIKAKLWNLHNASLVSSEPEEEYYEEHYEEYDEWYDDDDDRGCSGGICSCCGRTMGN